MRNDFTNWSSHDFIAKRFVHQDIYVPDLDCLLYGWMYLVDDASDSYGYVRHILKDNRLFQVMICNDPITDGLYEINSMKMKKVYQNSKDGISRLETVFVYPENFEAMTFASEVQDFAKHLAKNEYISEEESILIKHAKNVRPRNSDFIKGMLKLKIFSKKKEV